jgi:hypothetical protein
MLVWEQLQLAHRYRNTLIEIERGRRAAVRLAYSRVADLAMLEHDARVSMQRVMTASDLVKTHKIKNRTRKVPAHLRTELDRARVARREAVSKLKDARKATRTDEFQAELDRINDLAGELRRSARRHSGVYWGTYLLIEADMDAASKAPLYDGLEPNDPRFLKWNRMGRLGVQIQSSKPLPCELAFFDDKRVQIRMDNKRFGTLRMRVGSDGRAPIWAEWPLQLNRPLPPGEIKIVTVNVRRSGPREMWSVDFTIDKEFSVKPCGYGVVAVHLGWRVVEDGIRLAVAVDGEGNVEELVLRDSPNPDQAVRPRTERPRLTAEERRATHEESKIFSRACTLADKGDVETANKVLKDRPDLQSKLAARQPRPPKASILPALRKADELRGIRDKHFNQIRNLLRRWMQGVRCPEWLTERTRYMSNWRTQRHLVQLFNWWDKNRFDGDEDGFELLYEWWMRDNHLWRWECDQRIKSRNRRKDMYRTWAARLADRYFTIVLHEHDMSEVARKPDVDQENDVAKARSNRHLVAPHTLKDALVNAKRSRDGATVQFPTSKITITCAEEPSPGVQCGSVEQFDRIRSIDKTCHACGRAYDQDVNAARNMLRLFGERPADAKILGTARKVKKLDENGKEVETKRQRVARLAREKQARKQTSRDSVLNASETSAN